MKKALPFLLLASVGNAQIYFASPTNPAPPIYNQTVIPTAALGVTPTNPVKGLIALTSTGSACLFNGTSWVNLNAVNIITGLSVACVF